MRFYLLFYIDPLRTEENREDMIGVEIHCCGVNEEESRLWGELHSLNTYLDGKIWPLEELLEREI